MPHIILAALILLFTVPLPRAQPAPRVTCPDPTHPGAFQCSADCSSLGFCDSGANWFPSLKCPSGKLCVGGSCGNHDACPTSTTTTPVICSDPDFLMPNLHDNTCRTYYACSMPTGGGELGSGLLKECQAGKFFDSCTGACTANACSLPALPCTGSAEGKALDPNKQLLYACAYVPSLSTVWQTCAQGQFLITGTPPGPNCVVGVPSTCTNGKPGDGKCTPGRHPIAGTNCAFIECFEDGTFLRINCAPGYHFNTGALACVSGACS